MFNPRKMDKFFYNTTKWMVDGSRSRKQLSVLGCRFPADSLFAFVFVSFTLELVRICLCLPNDQFDWSPLANLFFRKYDVYFAASLIFIEIVILYSFRIFFFTPYSELLAGHLLYDLIVANMDIYHICSSKERERAKTWFAYLQSLFVCREVDLVRFARHHLSHFPNLSVYIRLMLVKLQIVAERIMLAYHYTLYVTFITVIIYFYTILAEPYQQFQISFFIYCPLIVFLNCIVFIQVLYTNRIFYLILYLIEVEMKTYSSHLKQYNIRLGMIKARLQSSHMCYLNLSVVHHFLREHTSVSYQVLQQNHELFAKVLITFFLTVMPMNILLVSRVIFFPLNRMEQFVFISISALQAVSIVSFLLFIAHLSHQIHEPKRHLNSIQFALESRHIIYKLKVDQLFDRVNSTMRKYGFALGSISTLTYDSVFQMLLIYVGYFIFVSTHFL